MSARPFVFDAQTRALAATGALLLALFFVLLPASFVDPRAINGAGVWEKPLKFGVSLSIHFFTIALLAQLLEQPRRQGTAMTLAIASASAAAVFEAAYVIMQAARGRRSHFNFETAFESMMYAAMGAGALLLVILPFVAGVLLALQRDGDRSGLKLGAVLGLTIGPVLTVVVAGYMSISGSHYAGAPNVGGPSDSGGLPFFGWSLTEPDLRPAHFVATHLIQALPAVGFVGDRIAPRLSRGLVFLATAGLATVSAGLFALALMGAAPLGVPNLYGY